MTATWTSHRTDDGIRITLHRPGLQGDRVLEFVVTDVEARALGDLLSGPLAVCSEAGLQTRYQLVGQVASVGG